MRYLSMGFAVGALRRGRGIEQFLGGLCVDGVAGVRWIEIWPVSNSYKVVVHDVLNIDEIVDLYEFPALVQRDEEYFGDLVGIAESELQAIALAAARCGTRDDRSVNQGVAGDEYHDYVAARHRARESEGDQQPADRQH